MLNGFEFVAIANSPVSFGSRRTLVLFIASILFRPGVFSFSSFLLLLEVSTSLHVLSINTPLTTIYLFSMKSNFGFLALLTISEQALGRELWLERDGRAIYLHSGRFRQGQPPAIQKNWDACPSAVCNFVAP